MNAPDRDAPGARRPIVSLQPERQKRLRAGHPWAYSNEVQMTAAAKALPPGTLVDLQTANGEPLGVAFFNPHPLVAARLVSREPGVAIDRDFLAARLRRALGLREQLFDQPYYRLIHAEADGLPGLIIDRYGDVLVVQCNSAGIARLEAELIAAAREVLDPRAIIRRPDAVARGIEGLPPSSEERDEALALGSLDGPVTVIENGARFEVDVLGGQKTGWFFDHRANRAIMAELAKGGRMLDLFAYAGGFGVAAAVAGARSVLMVDSAKPSLERATAAAAANGVAERCATMVSEGFAAMETLGNAGERYEVVVADPPAFVKSRKDYAVGVRAYRKMTRLAARLVKPAGFLLVASCSHNVEPESFAEEVRAGLIRAGRSGRILKTLGADADHPIHPFLPESAYLKATVLQLD